MNDKTLVEIDGHSPEGLRLIAAQLVDMGMPLTAEAINKAADALTTLSAENEAQATRIEALEAALRETMSRCTDCGGRGSFVKHDEVTDRDLWESCASCAVGYAALEGTKL